MQYGILKRRKEDTLRAFRKLGYPRGLLINLRNKARDIKESKRQSNADNQEENNERNIPEHKRFVVVPNSRQVTVISDFLAGEGTHIATTSGRKTSLFFFFNNRAKGKAAH